jgi:hypothetical protein
MLQEPGPPDSQRRAERAAGAGIAVGHIDRAALVRRDDRLQAAMAGERRQERVDQSARDHEQVGEALLGEGVENEVGAEGGSGCGWSGGRGSGHEISASAGSSRGAASWQHSG